MHSQFEEEMERQSKRLTKRIFEPPAINSVVDIRRVLDSINPNRSAASTPVMARMEAEDDKGRPATFDVKAAVDPHNVRDLLISGFESLKSRLDLQDKADKL